MSGAVTKWMCLLASTVFLSAGRPAFAQNAAAGEELAKSWCAGCHDIDSKETLPRNDVIPSFDAVARRPGTTQAGLRAFLSAPHANMPDYGLTPRQIRDLAAYILSLRKAGGPTAP